MEQSKRGSQIEYVKPEILDLGAVDPVYGGFCGTGSINASGDCTNGGIATGGICTAGTEVQGPTSLEP